MGKKNNDTQLKNIYFINLEHSKNRKQFMERHLSQTGHPFKRWAATNKATVTPASYREFTQKGPQAHVDFDGTGATYLSHVRLLKEISKKEDGVYMILEDDVKPHDSKTWADEVMCQIGELPKDWNVYKFGYINIMKGTQKEKGCYHKLPETGEFSCAMKWMAPEYMGLQGYATNPKGAELILKHLSEEPAFDIDGAMMNRPKDFPDAIKLNQYVSKRNFFIHGKFDSDRMR